MLILSSSLTYVKYNLFLLCRTQLIGAEFLSEEDDLMKNLPLTVSDICITGEFKILKLLYTLYVSKNYLLV